jgi:trehalose 6-phosphate synthase/phosphatase
MNLIAKEFLATKWEKEGALILSEMAGAADELSEAIIIDPNNLEEISHSLNYCLQMSKEEQSLRISAMQARLIFYDIFKWSDDFLTCLRKTQKKPVSIGYQQSYPQAKSYLQ